MTKPHTHLRSAGSAIAVALALASTPVLAQEVQTTPEPAPQVNAQPAPTVPTDPVLITPVLPPSTPTTTTAPPVTQPSATPSATTTAPQMRSNPVVQAVPEPAPVEETTEVAPAEPVTAPRQTASAPAPAPAGSPEPVASADADLAEAETAPLNDTAAPAPEFAEPIASGEPAIAPVDASDSSNGLTWLFGALAAIGLALLALLFFRRRGNPGKAERIKPYKPAPATKKPVAPAPAVATPVAEKAPAADDGFVNTQIRRDDAAVVTTMDRQPAKAAVRDAGLATAGASVTLPRKKPETVEERAALIDRLAAAKPDRANPFTAPKARRRRARLIVQSLDREFRNGSRIDLSQYPANWPHLARKTDTVVA